MYEDKVRKPLHRSMARELCASYSSIKFQCVLFRVILKPTNLGFLILTAGGPGRTAIVYFQIVILLSYTALCALLGIFWLAICSSGRTPMGASAAERPHRRNYSYATVKPAKEVTIARTTGHSTAPTPWTHIPNRRLHQAEAFFDRNRVSSPSGNFVGLIGLINVSLRVAFPRHIDAATERPNSATTGVYRSYYVHRTPHYRPAIIEPRTTVPPQPTTCDVPTSPPPATPLRTSAEVAVQVTPTKAVS
ncbi:hypothetical protein EV426DRAFT_640950 [Tirmania nivea]|nr:hypothetical protein EV426DRAFT_640950 [Tirmania nivea]